MIAPVRAEAGAQRTPLPLLCMPFVPCRGVPAESLQTDYEWVREYDQKVGGEQVEVGSSW